MEKFFKVIGIGVVFSAGVILLLPINVLFGYLAGLVLKLFCGDLLSNGLNLLFNTTRFHADQLPMVCAVLAAFSGYLRTNTTVKKEN